MITCALASPEISLASDGQGQVTVTVVPTEIDDLRTIPRLDAGWLQPTALTIDLTRLACVDSRWVVWILSIARDYAGVQVTLRVGQRAAAQLRMLRIDQVCAIASGTQA